MLKICEGDCGSSSLEKKASTTEVLPGKLEYSWIKKWLQMPARI